MSARLLDPSEVARVLGTGRQLVAELAATAADFPPPVDEGDHGRRRWDRHAIERWAAAQPDLAWGWSRPKLPKPGGMTERVDQIMRIAVREASGLNHDFLGDAHLLLALLSPSCPGAAPRALKSCGLGLFSQASVSASSVDMLLCDRRGRRRATLAVPALRQHDHPLGELGTIQTRRQTTRAFPLPAQGSGDAAARATLAVPPATNHALERARLHATELEDDEVLGEHGAQMRPRGTAGCTTAEPTTCSSAQTARRSSCATRKFRASTCCASELTTAGYRRWSRRAIIKWAAAHSERGPLREPTEPIGPGGMAPKLDQIFRLATLQAEQLNHSWVGRDHLRRLPACSAWPVPGSSS